jgi:hypothetical protein
VWIHGKLRHITFQDTPNTNIRNTTTIPILWRIAGSGGSGNRARVKRRVALSMAKVKEEGYPPRRY